MSKTKSRKKTGRVGNGIGAHHEISPMGHATRTLSKVEKRRKQDRKNKQKGWI